MKLVMQCIQFFDEQAKAFKVNMTLGFILRNQQTEEFRFFSPGTNSYMLPEPFMVTNRSSLRKLMSQIRKLQPIEYIKTQKPNSSWKPHYITNIQFDVTPTTYLLGKPVELPDYLLKKKSVVGMHRNPFNRYEFSDDNNYVHSDA